MVNNGNKPLNDDRGKSGKEIKRMKDSDDDFQQPFRIGTEFLHMGQTKDAIPFLEYANSVDPNDLDCVLNLSGAYVLEKKFRKAVALLESFSNNSSNNAVIWINLGAAYLGNPVLAGDKEQRKAIAAFKKALKIDPAAPSVAYNIGLIYRDREEYEKAYHWFKQAVLNNPKDEHAQSLLEKMDEKRNNRK